MLTLVLATRNRHKVAEIQALLDGWVRCRSLSEFPDAPELIEDADTFAGNAAAKAVQLAEWLAGQNSGSSRWVLADDSGLEVDALEGAPGVHSARFAAEEFDRPGNAPDAANNAKLLRLLDGLAVTDRAARFRCCLALVEVPPAGVPAASPIFFEGVVEGTIGCEARGQGGFGYDPLFVPVDREQTFGEMSEEEKNRISHRQAALARMREWIERRMLARNHETT
jgi:XTP/dITP diphosphohydrolase